MFRKHLVLAKLKQSAEYHSLFATLYNDTARKKYQMVRQKHPHLNKLEAISIASWTGGKYYQINKSLLGGEYCPWAEVAASHIDSALNKMPGMTYLSLLTCAFNSNNKEIGRRKVSDLQWRKLNGEKYPFTRNIKIPNPEEFIKLFECDTFVTDHLFATSFDPEYSTFQGNVVFKINSPIDGRSKGKPIDHLKSAKWESEILYPRGTKFRIDKIVKTIPPALPPKVKAKGVLNDLLFSISTKTPEARLNMEMPDFSNLSKMDAARLTRLFNKLTNYQYQIFLSEIT